MMLVFGAGVFGYWTYRQNQPAPMWVEMPVNPERTDEEKEKTVKELFKQLRDPALLTKVSKDMGLAAKWKTDSDASAATELSNRLFVKIGESGPPMGRYPVVRIGVRGKKKERELSGQISMRLMDDVWKILGIKPPPGR